MPKFGWDRRAMVELTISIRDGFFVGLLLFACWAVSLSLFADEVLGERPHLDLLLDPILRRHLVIAGTISAIIALLVAMLRVRGFIDARVNPSSMELFEKLTEDLPCLLYQFVQSPTGKSSVTYATAALESIYETSREAARADGSRIFDLVHPDDRERIWKALVESHTALKPWREEYRVVLPNAGIQWRLGQARVEKLPNGGTLWHGFVIDITAEKEIQARLAAEKLRAESANVAKSRFLAMMSHDIRTPMNGVFGFARLLEDTPLSDEQREHVQAIEHCSRTLLGLINDILDLSKIEAGQLTVMPTTFSMKQLVDEVRAVQWSRVLQKGIAFTTTIAPGTPMGIQTDRIRLMQVLGNLLGNAVKFTDEGSVTLDVSCETREDGDPVWTFRVTDTGPGIAESDIERIFETFQQVDGARRSEGSGLGLSIARQICRKLGGDVALTSEIGKGSVFTATIAAPAVSSVVAHYVGDAEADPRVDLTGMRVLLVDDNALNARLGALLLKRLGCESEVVNSADAAIRACRERTFDAVLMDVQMPGDDGLEATRRLRDLEAGGELAGGPRRLPVIALTANALHGDRAACLDAGMDDYLSKPIRERDLRVALQHARQPA